MTCAYVSFGNERSDQFEGIALNDVKTEICPLGELFSKCMEYYLDPVIESEGLERSKTIEPGFIFEYLLQNQKDKQRLKRVKQYIDTCVSEPRMCNLSSLNVFASLASFSNLRPTTHINIDNPEIEFKGFAIEDMKEAFAEFDKRLKNGQNKFDRYMANRERGGKIALEAFLETDGGISYKSMHVINDLESLIFAMLFEIVRNNKVIKKCKLCNRYFVPLKRSDEQYCNNPSPKDSSITCKKQNDRDQQFRRDHQSKSWELRRSILSALSKRYNNTTDSIKKDQRKNTKDVFRDESKLLCKMIDTGNPSQEDAAIDWLNDFKKRKKEIDENGYHENVLDTVSQILRVNCEGDL